MIDVPLFLCVCVCVREREREREILLRLEGFFFPVSQGRSLV